MLRKMQALPMKDERFLFFSLILDLESESSNLRYSRVRSCDLYIYIGTGFLQILATAFVRAFREKKRISRATQTKELILHGNALLFTVISYICVLLSSFFLDIRAAMAETFLPSRLLYNWVEEGENCNEAGLRINRYNCCSVLLVCGLNCKSILSRKEKRLTATRPAFAQF